jgi:hypothetical protein
VTNRPSQENNTRRLLLSSMSLPVLAIAQDTPDMLRFSTLRAEVLAEELALAGDFAH